jgi:hypothetical protein
MHFLRPFILFLFFCISHYCCAQFQDTTYLKYSVKKDIIGKVDFFTTDNLGQVYLIKGDQLFKYNKFGSLLFTYSNKVLGQITIIDASNPLRLLLYYRDFGQIEFLDDALSLIGSAINLEEKLMGQSTLACASTNDEMWLYDPLDFRLVRINQKLKVSYESLNINQISGTNILPNLLIEYNNWVYLNNPATGILVFDVYGTYSKTIPIKGLQSFKFEDNQLFYFKDKKLISYDLNRFSETEMMLPKLSLDAKNIRIERAEKLLAVLKENKLELFLIED